MKLKILFIAAAICFATTMTLFSGCASTESPLPTAGKVNLERFMGTWYVIGYTPIIVDKAAHNAVEHYFLSDEGKIETTYQFRDGNFEGELKTYTPTGFVANEESNAEWKMQFIWPFKSDYIIMYLSEDYERTIIAHPSKNYVWIMQRTPEMADDIYSEMIEKLVAVGYESDIVKRLPQDWSSDQDRMQQIEAIGAQSRLSESFQQ